MSKKTIYTQLSSLVFGACVMSLMASCGGTEKSAASPGSEKNPITQLGLEGRYIAKLNALNTSVAGVTIAEAKVQVIADQLAVSMEVKDSPASTTHSQFIYEGTECPSEIHDTNNDGFIDAIEASKVLGKILIPLDANLNSQSEGLESFPESNFLGNYSYYKEGVLSQLVADLTAPDMDEKDEITKLSGSDLQLEGKVVVVQGVSNQTYIPGSVATFDGLSDRATLTIACGKISRVMIDESETTHEEESRPQ